MRRGSAAVLVALGVAALAAGSVAIRSYDFGWHVRAGEWILSHGGRPPLTDPIAFTAEGREWVDHEWLFQLLLAALVRAGGVAAAWGLKLAAVLAAALIPAAWLLGRGLPPAAVLALGLLALEGARFRFFARPELAGLVLVPVTLILLSGAARRAGQGHGPGMRLWVLPALVAVWVNLHPSALLGAGLVAVFALTLVASPGQRRHAGPFLLVAGACVAALLANPYGARVLAAPLAIAAALRGGDLANPEWGTAFRGEFWLFWLTLATLAGSLVLVRRRGWRVEWPLVACGLVLAATGALALRQIGTFFMALPVMACAGWDPVPRPRHEGEGAGAWRHGSILAAGLLVAAWFLARPAGGPVGPGLAPGRYPEGMARTFLDAGLQGPIYNPVRFGGYLAWALAPEKVFLDGRNEVHAPLLAEIAACRQSPDPTCWDAILERWGVRTAFVEYDPRRVAVRLPDGRMVSRSLTSVYFRRDRWALVDWDDTALLYVRREGRAESAAPLSEDRLLTPEDPEWFAASLAAGGVDPGAALDEIARRRARHPASERAALLERLAREALGEAGEAQPAPLE